MRHRKWMMAGFLAVATSAIGFGCKPRTPTQKVEDKLEDAGHEVHQGLKRAGENIDNATK